MTGASGLRVGLVPVFENSADLEAALDRLPAHFALGTVDRVVAPVRAARLPAGVPSRPGLPEVVTAPIDGERDLAGALAGLDAFVVWREIGAGLDAAEASAVRTLLSGGRGLRPRHEPVEHVGWRPSPSSRPRLLVLDPTPTGGLSATGQLKRNLLAGWPDESFLQIFGPEGGRAGISRRLDWPDNPSHTVEEAVDAIAEFDPQVVYYRPILDRDWMLHRLAQHVRETYDTPFVVQVMDDWPSRLSNADPERGAAADRALREALGWAGARLSISEKMSYEFAARYGYDFEPFANGVDPGSWPAPAASAPGGADGSPFVLRYTGGLARDMTFDTVLDVARSVDRLQSNLDLRFEIYTMPWWSAEFAKAMHGLRGVELLPSVGIEEYPSLLTGADALLLGYNFDAESIRYVGLSMPNKLPEYLASGTPVLAVGPVEANGVSFARTHGLAACITERDPRALDAALRSIARRDPEHAERATRARRWAFEHLDIGRLANRFHEVLTSVAATGKAPDRV